MEWCGIGHLELRTAGIGWQLDERLTISAASAGPANFFFIPQLYLWGSLLLGEIFAYVAVFF